MICAVFGILIAVVAFASGVIAGLEWAKLLVMQSYFEVKNKEAQND